MVWAVFLLTNRLQLSKLQIEWTHAEQTIISFAFLLPSLIGYFLSIPFTPSPEQSQEAKVNPSASASIFKYRAEERAGFVLVFAASSILAIDLTVNGIPLLNLSSHDESSVSLASSARLQARIPVLYTISHQFFLVGCIALAVASFHNKVLTKNLCFFCAIYLMHSFAMMARGSATYLIAAIFLCFIFFDRRTLLFKLIAILGPLCLALWLFHLTGELRTDAGQIRDGYFDINAYGLFSEETPHIVSWIYGYLILSADNLILCIRDFNESEFIRFKSLQNFAPALYNIVFQDSYNVDDFTHTQTMPYVGRFNLVTGFGHFAYDAGWLGIYIFATLIFFISGLLFTRKLVNLSFLQKIVFTYLILGFTFFPMTNLFFSSRTIGFFMGVLTLALLIKRQKAKGKFID